MSPASDCRQQFLSSAYAATQLIELAESENLSNPASKARNSALLQGAVFHIAQALKSALLQYVSEPFISDEIIDLLKQEQNIENCVREVTGARQSSTELAMFIQSMGHSRIQNLIDLYSALWATPQDLQPTQVPSSQLIAVDSEEKLSLTAESCKAWIAQLYAADQVAIALSVES